MKYILLLVPVLLFSCKKDSQEVDQDSIYQSYEISYDASSNLTTFTAEFREGHNGGKRLKLNGGSQILINGQTMSRNGSTYSKSYNGYLASGTFEFVDSQGKSYSNVITCEEWIQNDFNTSIQNNNDTYWYFSGPQLSAGETITVDINSYETDGGKASAFTSNLNAYFVRITAYQMSNLLEGQASVKTTRSSMVYAGNWTKAGGSMKSEYRSSLSNIVVY